MTTKTRRKKLKFRDLEFQEVDTSSVYNSVAMIDLDVSSITVGRSPGGIYYMDLVRMHDGIKLNNKELAAKTPAEVTNIMSRWQRQDREAAKKYEAWLSSTDIPIASISAGMPAPTSETKPNPPIYTNERNENRQHKQFNEVLACMSARVNLALVGPAGSGKSVCLKKAAQQLGLDYYTVSLSAQTPEIKFFGYQDANGRYVRTLFREAYEYGGVFVFDEFDNGNPNVLAALNQATANDTCAFADGMVTKHPDFVCVMAGNTYGDGPTSEYVGRNRIDAATLDRFAFMYFGYDTGLELALSTDIGWASCVIALREKAAKKGIKCIISPRATFNGEKLFKAGLGPERVIELTVIKGMNQDEKELLADDIKSCISTMKSNLKTRAELEEIDNAKNR